MLETLIPNRFKCRLDLSIRFSQKCWGFGGA